MAEWSRLGLPLWVRFLAIGTPEPLKAAAAWLRSHGQAQRQVLLADSIRWGLTTMVEPPDARALAALGVSAEQIALVRGGDPAVFLVLVDQLTSEAAAQACGTTVSALDAGIARIRAEWDAAAPPRPSEGQQDDHLDTVRMAALLADELGGLQQQQAEAHLEACPSCGERYIAWVELKDAFDQLPMPPPPPKKSYTVPVVLTIAGMTASALSVLAVVMFGTFTMDQAEADRAWRDQPAVVRLVQDDRVIQAPASPDSVVSIAVDPLHAPFLAVVLRKDESLEVLHAGPVEGSATQLVPVDVIVGDQQEQIAYVVLSRTPISSQAALDAARGQVAPGLSVAMARIR